MKPIQRVVTPVRHSVRLVLVAIAILVSVASPAAAHVNAKAVGISDDGVATVEFSFNHGCQGQPTNALYVQVPSNVSDVTPQPLPGWTVESGADRFGWSGGSVPDHERITFTATMRVWGEAGQIIWFKAIQKCGELEEAWVETPAPGAPEPENVAPSITLPRTIQAPTTTTTTPPTTSAPSSSVTTSTVAEAAMAEESGSQSTVGLVVLGVVTAAIIGGALVLYLRHRTPR